MAWFRIGAFGLIAFEVSGLMRNEFFQFLLTKSEVRFPYHLIPVNRVFNVEEMNVLYALVVSSAILCSIGLMYRYARWVFLFSYSYLFFQDKMFWNNHWYLFILIGIMGILVDLGKNYSVDTLIKPERRETICPRWHYYLFCVQIGLVYFFGGVAKLNIDWLVHAEPIGIFLADRQDHFLFGSIFRQDWAKYFFAYGGAAFDLVITFLLFYKRTFKLAVLLTVVFNGINIMIFHIGIFPYFMLASNLLFAHVLLSAEPLNKRLEFKPSLSGVKKSVVVIYLVFQVLFPLRQFLYSGNPSWIGICERFSWRMMIQHKEEKSFKFYIYHRDEEMEQQVNIQLPENQRIAMIAFPEVISDYAIGLREFAESTGLENIEVRADIQVNLNNGSFQYLVDRNVDLSRVNRNYFQAPSYIIPRVD